MRLWILRLVRETSPILLMKSIKKHFDGGRFSSVRFSVELDLKRGRGNHTFTKVGEESRDRRELASARLD